MLVNVGHVAASVDALLAGAERREPFANPDGRSTAGFERVWIDGAPHVVKYLHLDHDFTMRVSGDIGCRPVRAWATACSTRRPISSTTPSSERPRGTVAMAGVLPCSCGTSPPIYCLRGATPSRVSGTPRSSTTLPASAPPRGAGRTTPPLRVSWLTPLGGHGSGAPPSTASHTSAIPRTPGGPLAHRRQVLDGAGEIARAVADSPGKGQGADAHGLVG